MLRGRSALFRDEFSGLRLRFSIRNIPLIFALQSSLRQTVIVNFCVPTNQRANQRNAGKQVDNHQSLPRITPATNVATGIDID